MARKHIKYESSFDSCSLRHREERLISTPQKSEQIFTGESGYVSPSSSTSERPETPYRLVFDFEDTLYHLKERVDTESSSVDECDIWSSGFDGRKVCERSPSLLIERYAACSHERNENNKNDLDAKPNHIKRKLSLEFSNLTNAHTLQQKCTHRFPKNLKDLPDLVRVNRRDGQLLPEEKTSQNVGLELRRIADIVENDWLRKKQSTLSTSFISSSILTNLLSHLALIVIENIFI